MTQLKEARLNKITPEMQRVAQIEDCDVEMLRENIAEGRAVIPYNKKRKSNKVCGVGKGLRTKVNANIGTSVDYHGLEEELDKLRAAEEAQADAVMDLSTGGDLRTIRKEIMENCSITMGSVPIYEAVVDVVKSKHSVRDMTAASMLDAVRRHCEDGIDFITVHCGVTQGVLKHLTNDKRICGVVSRGGAFLVDWMSFHKKENPLYELYDEIVSIAYEYDVTLSLGDALRPGALADACDRAQIYELNMLAELTQRAQEANVQVIVEGPGHVPLNQIPSQIQLQKELCKGAPFYVLGPIVTDIAPGYDHITSAIGGAIAASSGADFLCYVTPTEHLSLPKPDDVHDGVMATRIAAHAADIAKGLKTAWEWDKTMSQLRRKRDWEGQFSTCIDPPLAKKIRKRGVPQNEEVCSMCAEFCVFKVADDGHNN